MNIQNFVDDIREEKSGFKFGSPWRYSKSSLAAILPIIRKNSEKRGYVTLAEAGKNVIIEDSGSISEAIITNKGKIPVFIRAGEMLKGSTQTRTVIVSRVVMPGQTATVKIACIFMSKGIQQGAKFSSAGYASNTVENMVMNEAYKGGGQNVNQSNIWGSVHTYSVNMVNASMDLGNENAGSRGASYNARQSHGSIRTMRSADEATQDILQGGGAQSFYTASSMDGYANPTTGAYDDLEGNMKKFGATMQELFKSLPKVDWQAGAALLGVNGLQGLEVFDLPDSWTAMKSALAEKSAEDLSRKDQKNAFEFNPKKAKGMVTDVLSEKFTEKDLFKDEKTRTVGIELSNLIGQVTLSGDKVIHLNLTQKN